MLRVIEPAECTIDRMRTTIENALLEVSQRKTAQSKPLQECADSWTTPRRRVEHHVGELFPRVSFIVTSLTLPNRAVVRFYNKRGTAEQWIKEGKQAAHWTRLSCHRFRANEVRLQLSVLAYNLGNLGDGSC